jgi:hypothetical protein
MTVAVREKTVNLRNTILIIAYICPNIKTPIPIDKLQPDDHGNSQILQLGYDVTTPQTW